MFKMTRIFRITMIINVISKRNKNISVKSDVYFKFRKLFSKITIIIPIVLKFFPIYLISCYILGIIGMMAFNNSHAAGS